jgi:hypothetical protein
MEMLYITISNMDAVLDVYIVEGPFYTTQFVASWTPNTNKNFSEVIQDLWCQMDKVDKFYRGECDTISF